MKVILHGGAGRWKDLDKALEVLETCARKASEARNPLDAVLRAVVCMEDSGVLNAGRGSVMDLMGYRSLDAGIMSSDGKVGAVANVRFTRNPILLAREVMDMKEVIISGHGADMLAIKKGLPPLPPPSEELIRKYKELKKNLPKELSWISDTVGAVAFDGKLIVAGTSTGGLWLKFPGRIGDTPIPGAGFYARRVGCSSTGIGEKIIMTMPCLKLDMYYEGDLEKAMDKVMEEVERTVARDTMGFIAISEKGEVGFRYNTRAMPVAIVEDGKIELFH